MNVKGKIRTQGYVCPWWLIGTFDNPLRKLIQKPEKILNGLVSPGSRCLDIGCGFGYYSIAMARMTGSEGQVTSVDIQQKMLDGTLRRAKKRNLAGRITLHLSNASKLDLKGDFDFALAFWMVHEVKEQEIFIQTVYHLLKPGGKFLIVEPRIHVNRASFENSIALAKKAGFQTGEKRKVFFSRGLIMEKR